MSGSSPAPTHCGGPSGEEPPPHCGWRYVASRSRDTVTGEILWEVRELYPTHSGFDYTENAIGPAGETLEEMRADLANMLKDMDRPYLDLTVDPPRIVPQGPSA